MGSSQEIIVRMVNGDWPVGWILMALNFARKENFLFSKCFRPGLGPTEPPTQWVLVFFPIGHGLKVSRHLHLELQRCSFCVPSCITLPFSN
jgi:hypothetical protein